MDLIRFLVENKNSRKVFGRREIKIIEKQVKGVKLTQSEKNRLSRDIRIKLEFIKECSRFSNEFKLKKGAEIKNLIDEVKEEILNDKLRNKIKEIWVFGSFVDNTMTFRSDLDIAVLFDKISLREATLFRMRISRNFSEKIDIQVFNVLPEKIKKSIIEKHSLIWKG